MPARRGRVRRALMWIGLSFTLVLLSLWLSTRWWQIRGFVHWGSTGWTYGIAGGAAWVEYVEPGNQRPPRTAGLSLHAIASEWRWLPEFSWDRSASSMWSGVIA